MSTYGLGGEMYKTIAAKGCMLLPPRLMIGFGFAAHGYAKLSRGPKDFAAIRTAIGVPQPQLVAWTAGNIRLQLLGASLYDCSRDRARVVILRGGTPCYS